MYESNINKAHRNEWRDHRFQGATPSEQSVARIVSDMETLKQQSSRFDYHLSRWQRQRRETIATLVELRDKLQTVDTCANVFRGAGSATILAGGLASLVGAILEMNHAEGSRQWRDAGKNLRKLGEFAVPVVSLLELGISEIFMDNVKTVLEQDQKYSEPLNEWIHLSSSLDTRVEQTFGCSITSVDFGEVLSTFCHSLKMMKSGRRRDAIRNAQRSKNFSLLSFAENLQDASLPNLLDMVQKVQTFFQNSSGTLRLCQSGVELRAAICGRSSPLSVMPVVSSAFDSSFRELGLTSRQRKCGLEAVRVASDVVNMVFTAKNIAESQSKYCQQLDSLKSKLSMELLEVSRSSRNFLHS